MSGSRRPPASYLPADIWYNPTHPGAGFVYPPVPAVSASPVSAAASPDPNMATGTLPQVPPPPNHIFNDALRYGYAWRDSVAAGAPPPVAPWPTAFDMAAHAPAPPIIDPSLVSPTLQQQSEGTGPQLGATLEAESSRPRSKRKEAPPAAGATGKAKRARKSKNTASAPSAAATTVSDENAEPSSMSAAGSATTREPLASLVRAKAGTAQRKDSASDVWWAMIPISTSANSNTGLIKLSGRDGPSDEEREIEPGRSKPTASAAQRIACRYCRKWTSWANTSGITSTIRDHLMEHHFKTPSGASGPWRDDIIKHSLKGYDTLADMNANERGLRSDVVNAPGHVRPMSYPEGTFTLDGFIQRLVRWIIVDDQSVNVIETPELRDLLLYLHAGLEDKEIPKRSKLTKVIFQRFVEEYEALIREMKDAEGRISFTSDCWTDPFLRPFMAITAHYCIKINGQLEIRNRLIAFRHLPGSHTGSNMADAFLAVLKEIGIERKIGIITLDNASNNNTMMESLEFLLEMDGIPFDRVQNRGRCFPHVINIAVQTALKMLSKSAPQPDKLDEHELPATVQTISVQARDSQDKDYVAALQDDPVDRCRQLVSNCRKSSQRREDFLATIEEGNKNGDWQLPVNHLLRDVDTRWSSTFLMIDRVLELNQAIDVFLDKNKQTQISSSRLSQSDIEVLDDIRHVLAIPHVVQQMLSSEKTPTLSNVLPTYEALVASLKQLEEHEQYIYLKPAISAAISKIEAYMTSARATRAYVLAMAINPMCKLELIEGNWETEEVEQAKDWLLEAMLEHRIAQRRLAASQTTTSPSSSGNQASANRPSTSSGSRQPRSMSNIAFGLSELHAQTASALARTSKSHRAIGRGTGSQGDISPPSSLDTQLPSAICNVDSVLSQTTAVSEPAQTPEEKEERAIEEDRLLVKLELQRWSSAGVIPTDSPQRESFDLVRWWQNKADEKEYPYLYRVALDIMPMQASAVPCERVFSSSKHTASLTRSQISPQFMEVCQILKYLFKQQRLDSTGEWCTSDPREMEAADPPEDLPPSAVAIENDFHNSSLSERLDDLYGQLFTGETF